MPSVLTHLNIANCIIRDRSNFDAYRLFIGTITPDCIDFSDNMQYKETHYIQDNGRIGHDIFINSNEGLRKSDYDFFLGYHLHLWFDYVNCSMDISSILKEISFEESILSKVKREISFIDILSLSKIDMGKMKEVCVNEYGVKVATKLDEVISSIKTVTNFDNSLKYVNEIKYADYINKMAKEYSKRYL